MSWLTTREAATRARVSTRTIQRMVSNGSLPAKRFGPRLVRIESADLDAAARSVA
ncbi:helix-turn-helix domain-containing protein [Mycobacterium arosiense]|uniref:helix-turn-helix domain-containing protein n=1 Tax=Mycobacterium arosiense TaxID=425468 RepID=UPI0009F6754C|nr:helix-turn-helix domain-containing protein [Mycobacterium arosiense]